MSAANAAAYVVEQIFKILHLQYLCLTPKLMQILPHNPIRKN